MTVSGGFENSVPEAILTQAKNSLLTTYVELELFNIMKYWVHENVTAVIISNIFIEAGSRKPPVCFPHSLKR